MLEYEKRLNCHLKPHSTPSVFHIISYGYPPYHINDLHTCKLGPPLLNKGNSKEYNQSLFELSTLRRG